MRRLTPELWAISSFEGNSDALESRQLDFNLARRSGIVINHILGQLALHPDTTTGFETIGSAIQELDVDPDNIDIEFAGVLVPEGFVLDSSRVFRQTHHFSWDTAAGAVGWPNNVLQKDWTNLPFEQRPISITPLRHHVAAEGAISNTYQAEIHINYIIVELELWELGVINASRR